MARTAKLVGAVLVVGLVVGAGATLALVEGEGSGPTAPDEPSVADGLTTFDNESAYNEYLRTNTGYAVGGGVTIARPRVQFDAADAGNPSLTAEASASAGDGGQTVRIGGTNVQEAGIDEPDLVATVGSHFVYAPGGGFAYRLTGDVVDRGDVMIVEDDPRLRPRSHVVDASEPADPELVAEINASGKLLQSGDTLVALSAREVTAYDVSDPENPTERWHKTLNSSIETARMNDGQLYVVTRTRPNHPCPIRPMGEGSIPCTDIYRPQVQIDADATYTAHSIAPEDGAVADRTSFVGTRGSTVVYMSESALYVTYTDRTGRAELRTDYLIEEASAVPDDVKNRLREVRSYDLSPRAERIEVQNTVREWLNSLSPAERAVARESLEAGLKEYADDRQRELTETGIVRIGVGDGDLSVDATGTVPGRPLNQFSMDEHDGTVRIATTIPGVYGAKSENDLYTLDNESLERLGAETGMGVDERIYSVRYVGDTAYMVTFRQIDPFHVVDLSDPRNPTELGNVELPGFSDYLHPVGEDTIMGIGEEDGQVKAVLFDVSDPANPTVADSRIIDAHWSAVSNSHHAFMQDPRHGVAFLPAGNSGFVLDYSNQTLSVEKKISLETAPERARYVGDYLYVFSPAEIAVYDETTWDRETEIVLRSDD